MNPTVQLNLALILFLPWYAILAGVFWGWPRQPRTAARTGFDVAALLAATGLSVAAMHWGFLTADTSVGELWRQVLATSVSYGVFLGAMALACVLRAWLIVHPHRRRADAVLSAPGANP